MSLVANSRQILVSATLLRFDPLELGVVETCRVLLVLQLCRLHVILQAAEVVLAKLGLLVRLESLVERWLLTLVVLGIDGGARRFRERLAEQVL